MHFYGNIEAERDRIQACIETYGYTPDHNLDWFLYCADEGEPRVILWDEGYALFGYENANQNTFVLLADLIAPKDKYEDLLKESIQQILSDYKKITVFDIRDYTHNIIKSIYLDRY